MWSLGAPSTRRRPLIWKQFKKHYLCLKHAWHCVEKNNWFNNCVLSVELRIVFECGTRNFLRFKIKVRLKCNEDLKPTVICVTRLFCYILHAILLMLVLRAEKLPPQGYFLIWKFVTGGWKSFFFKIKPPQDANQSVHCTDWSPPDRSHGKFRCSLGSVPTGLVWHGAQ